MTSKPRSPRCTASSTRSAVPPMTTVSPSWTAGCATSADAWAPHVLLVAPHLAADRTSVDQLLAAMRYRGTRSAIPLVLAEDPEQISATRWQLHLEMDGTLRIPALDLTL